MTSKASKSATDTGSQQSSVPPTLLMVGLGRMGSNMARRLAGAGAAVHGYDRSIEARAAVAETGPQFPVVLHDQLQEAVSALPSPRMVWLMLPAGAATKQTVEQLVAMLHAGDVVIDGGNANYLDSQALGRALETQGIGFVDCGVSGGVWGLQNGYCLMYGAAAADAATVAPVMRLLAVSPTEGWLHCGPVGSGHFVKMIHNGIEYGMMQAFAEGFALLAGKPEFDLKLGEIGELWRHGSVVRSWLLDLTAIALAQDPELKNYSGFVEDSGEGRWTIMAAIEEAVPAHVLSAALYARFRSRDEEGFSDKVLSAMRHQFGGHVEPKSRG